MFFCGPVELTADTALRDFGWNPDECRDPSFRENKYLSVCNLEENKPTDRTQKALVRIPILYYDNLLLALTLL